MGKQKAAPARDMTVVLGELYGLLEQSYVLIIHVEKNELEKIKAFVDYR